MMDHRIYVGFSLVEILVSLFVVSLAAVNITGLQKLVGEQNRDNFSHIFVIELVSDKFEEVMQYNELQDVINLNGSSSSFRSKGTNFDFKWVVKMVEGAPTSSSVREVSMIVTWSNATGDLQVFTHQQQISFAMLSKEGADSGFPYTVANLLGTNKVKYFEPKIGYKKDAYVIYDSQLFQAIDTHSIANIEPLYIEAPIDSTGKISAGWLKVGPIDDEDLAHLFID